MNTFKTIIIVCTFFLIASSLSARGQFAGTSVSPDAKWLVTMPKYSQSVLMQYENQKLNQVSSFDSGYTTAPWVFYAWSQSSDSLLLVNENTSKYVHILIVHPGKSRREEKKINVPYLDQAMLSPSGKYTFGTTVSRTPHLTECIYYWENKDNSRPHTISFPYDVTGISYVKENTLLVVTNFYRHHDTPLQQIYLTHIPDEKSTEMPLPTSDILSLSPYANGDGKVLCIQKKDNNEILGYINTNTGTYTQIGILTPYAARGWHLLWANPTTTFVWKHTGHNLLTIRKYTSDNGLGPAQQWNVFGFISADHLGRIWGMVDGHYGIAKPLAITKTMK